MPTMTSANMRPAPHTMTINPQTITNKLVTTFLHLSDRSHSHYTQTRISFPFFFAQFWHTVEIKKAVKIVNTAPVRQYWILGAINNF